MASVAEEQLGPRFIHTYSRFPVYLYPAANEHRIQLVAQSMILFFAFDGKHIQRLLGSTKIEQG